MTTQPLDPTDPTTDTNIDFTAIQRLSADLKKAVVTMTPDQARFLVDAYYQMQANRIRADHQVRQMAKESEPHDVLDWLSDNSAVLESQVRLALLHFAKAHHMGKWAMGICGIGPVIAAGLLAHIDIEQAPTVGHIWAFAGLDPTRKWLPKTKRPWNADLKVLCWKIGESFVKVSGNKNDYYGQVYLARKEYESRRNDQGLYAEQAAAGAARVAKTTEAYKHYSVGKLPPGHLHARAQRYAVKLFLSHWHGEAYQHHYHKPPPRPYPIAKLEGHQHFVEPPPVAVAQPSQRSVPYARSAATVSERTCSVERSHKH